MENKRNLVSNESIAELYAFQKADNLCGIENQNSEAWNKEYNFHYNEKMKELTKEKSTREVGDLRLHQGEIVDESYPIEFQEAYLKPNQKQFTHFSPELFKKYIDKFSDEDKNKAFQLIFDSINDDKKHSFLVKSEIIDWYKSNCY